MKEKKYKNNRYQIGIPIILAIGIAAGMLIGATFSDQPAIQNDVNSNVHKFREVLTQIDKNYVDEVNTDKLVEDAIVHMLAGLDPHSAYISAKDKREANEDLQGNFEGIGIEFNIFQDTIVVVSPLSGGPSEKVGILPGDKIVQIDGKDVAGNEITNEDVRDHLKGPKNTHVQVGIKRKGVKELLSFDIERDRIPQFSVDADYMIDDQIGYIKVSRFSATTYEEFVAALENLKSKGMTKLILDLQGNPGGYMDRAIRMADEFLPDHDKIVYTKGKEKRFDEEAFADHKGLFEEGDLIVLVNEGSASASEIVTGALQDNDRALVVGRRSFGKGLVQAPMNLSDGSELRLTISRYYTPSGRSIQKPYESNDDYGKDLLERYEHGEFFSADSITFNDSLKYKTTSGRTVYGGGGIMPDYFVPLDTLHSSSYLNRLFASNSLQEYTFRYVGKHRKELASMEYDKFFHQFTVNDEMLNDLMDTGKANGIKPVPAEVKIHHHEFQLQVKAQIARQIWDNQGFYPIYNQSNEILQQAIKLFDKNSDLEKAEM